MSQVFVDRPAVGMTGEPARKRWARDEVAVLEKVGLFDGTHYELVEGELINKMGKKAAHVFVLAFAVKLLRRIFGEDFVLTETPVDVAPEDNPASHPEPDAVLLGLPYAAGYPNLPRAGDVLLVVEVSDTTLAFDVRVKTPLYARAGIAECWIIDVNFQRILVHRDPREGVYQSMTVYGETDTIEPLAKPGAVFLVAGVFPPR